MLCKMLHRHLPGNNRIRSAIFPLFLNLNPNGEGPHQWNFNSIIYCSKQNVNKHTHIHPHKIMCTKVAQNGLDFHFKYSMVTVLIYSGNSASVITRQNTSLL